MDCIKVSKQHIVYALSSAHAPVLSVPGGTRLVFEACDALGGQITREDQSIAGLDWEQVNPATGPVFIEGAEAGDALKVSIHSIRFTGAGVIAAIPGVGIFAPEVAASSVRLVPVQHGSANFGDGIHLPITPMIGVIGTAPKGAPVPCGTPGNHGGNMDCTKIAPGNILFLPVYHKGALLCMGDVHACMGDGEIMGSGVEIAADIEVTVELLKGKAPPLPLLETPDMLYAIASDNTLEKAAIKAARVIRQRVEETLGLDKNAAGMLLSAAGSAEICQMVDPLQTVRFGVPKFLLQP